VQGISICADWATQGDHKGRSYHGRPDASWATTRTGRPHANRTTPGCEPDDRMQIALLLLPHSLVETS